jgi:hypothetical protein
VFWRVVKGLEVRRREVWMEVVAPQRCRRANRIAKKRHVFLAQITCLETAGGGGSFKIQFAHERTSSVCFQASPAKSFLTLLLFYIPESFLEPAVSRDVDNQCQP